MGASTLIRKTFSRIANKLTMSRTMTLCATALTMTSLSTVNNALAILTSPGQWNRRRKREDKLVSDSEIASGST
jgi:hypothetical protein